MPEQILSGPTSVDNHDAEAIDEKVDRLVKRAFSLISMSLPVWSM